MAAVARSVMNRAGLIQSGEVNSGTFMSNSGSISDVITAKNQYQPVVNGRVMQDGVQLIERYTSRKTESIKRTLELAKDTDALKERFESKGMTESQVRNMMGQLDLEQEVHSMIHLKI